MKTILQFIWDVKLSKSDEAVLIEHVEASQEKLSGPGLSDKCTNTVRYSYETWCSLQTATVTVQTPDQTAIPSVLAVHIMSCTAGTF